MPEETFVIGPKANKLSLSEINWKDIKLKDIDELVFSFYYDSKNHRYRISINYGEAYIYVTEKRGEAIFIFLKFVEEFLGRRRNLRHRSANEETFDFQDDEEFFDKMDFEDEWDSWEKDQLVSEEADAE